MAQDDALRRMTQNLPLGTDVQSTVRRIAALERLLEGLIDIPLVGRKVGLDAIVGLVPGAGDLITGAMGLYLVWEARNLGMPRWQLWRMAGNVGIDALVGAVPVAGDLFDFLYRSNTKNLKIIRKHIDRHHPSAAVVQG